MQQSREMAAVVAHRLKHREPTTATDHLVCASLDFIKRHDAAIFATVRMVNLTIMRLMGWSGPNAFGHMENMLKGSDEGYKRNANLDEIEEEYGDAYCSFYRRLIEIQKAVDLIPTSTTIPAESRAKLEELAQRFPKKVLGSLLHAVDPGYYLQKESIQSPYDVVEPYLFHSENAVEVESLGIDDIFYQGILKSLVNLEAEIQGPSQYTLSEPRRIATKLMAWVVKAFIEGEIPSSNRGRKQLFKKELKAQKEALERKFAS